MRILEEHFRMFEFQDKDGNFIVEPDFGAENMGDDFYEKSKTASYFTSRIPEELRTHIYRLNDDGSQTDIGSHGGTYSGELVVAIVNSGDYNYFQAVILAADTCERCLNVLLNKYMNEGDTGYEEFSEEWKKCGTQCAHCKHLPWKKPHSLGRPLILCVGSARGFRNLMEELEIPNTTVIRNSFRLIQNPQHARGLRDQVEDIWWIDGAGTTEIGRNTGCLDWLQAEIDQARKDRQARKLTRVEPPIEGTT